MTRRSRTCPSTRVRGARTLVGFVALVCLIVCVLARGDAGTNRKHPSQIAVPVQQGAGSPVRPASAQRRADGGGVLKPPASLTGSGPATQARLVETYGKLPLTFEANQGQTDERVKFLSRGRGYTLFLTGNEGVLSLRKPVQIADGKRQMANGAAQRLPFNAAAFPGLLRSPAAGPETNSRTADPRTGSALQGLALIPTSEQLRNSSAPPDEARMPNLPRPRRDGAETEAPAVLRMKLVGANAQAKVSGLEEQPGRSNYFVGNDPKKWRTNVSA